MAEEEFQESEVIFSDNEESTNFDNFHVASKHGRFMRKPAKSSNKTLSNSKKNMNKKIISNSVPVNIPETVFRLPEDYSDDGLGPDWIAGAGELVPPHLVVGRRLAGGNMAYSVCTGTGRTLKGRDLSQLRNSILRLTGFLET